MTLRWTFSTLVLLMASIIASAQPGGTDLAFGQVYGSTGFLSAEPSGTMTDAPATVLVFTAEDGHRTLALTQQTGDYIALLERGRYCIAAYTRAGRRLQLASNQLKCVDAENGKDVRLDVMLLRDQK
jgi:hypothetical protein